MSQTDYLLMTSKCEQQLYQKSKLDQLLSICFDFQEVFELFVTRVLNGRVRNDPNQSGRVSSPKAEKTRFLISDDQKVESSLEVERQVLRLEEDLCSVEWSDRCLGQSTSSGAGHQRWEDALRVWHLWLKDMSEDKESVPSTDTNFVLHRLIRPMMT